MEVDQRLLGDLGLDVALVLGLLKLLDGGVVGGDVGVVVLGVVELHDLAADGGLERAVVVWRGVSLACLSMRVVLDWYESNMRRTGKVRQGSLSTDEGGAANGCARGGSGADGGAHGAGTEEGGGHDCVCCWVCVLVLEVKSIAGGAMDKRVKKRSQHACEARGALSELKHCRPFRRHRDAGHRTAHRNTDDKEANITYTSPSHDKHKVSIHVPSNIRLERK